jgi:transcriptional regulator with XRE-family HTH domain
VSQPNRIREIREQRKREDPGRFTQKALADLLGVNKATLCRWEAGATIPTRRNAKALARRLGVAVEQLELDGGPVLGSH